MPQSYAPARRIIGLNFAAMAQHGVMLLLLGPLVPSIMTTFGIGESVAGLMLGVGAAGFILGPLVAGALIDRINVRAALIAGLSIEIVTLALFGTAPALALTIAAIFVMRFGASFVETAANVMPTLTGSKRSQHSVMNLVHMFFSIGAFVGPVLIGIYIGTTGEWRPIPLFALVPTVIVLTWAMLTRLPRRPADSETPGMQARRRSFSASDILVLVRMPHVLFGALTLMLYVGSEVGISSWVVHYLQKHMGASTAAAAAGLSILWVAIMVGRFLNSIVGNRFAGLPLVVVSGVAGAAGTLAFLFARNLSVAYVLLGWIGLCLSGTFPNVMAAINNRLPGKSGSVTAIMAMGAALGAGVFQWLVGFLAETFSLTVAFITPVVLQLLLVGSFAVAVRSLPAPTDSAAASES